MNTNIVEGTLIETPREYFDNNINRPITQGIPIIIPEYIKEVDKDDELISEIVLPECFEGNYIASWSDNDGSEGLIIDGIFDSGEEMDDFFIEIPELRNIVRRYFDYDRLNRELEENN